MRGAEPRPLAGKVIVLTRAAEHAAEWTARLESLGAEVLHLPMVAFAEAEGPEALDTAIRSLGEFDWLIFTSQNAVRFFAARVAGAREAAPLEVAGRRPKIAAVGPATARAAEEAGFPVDRVASEHRGSVLAEELAAKVKGKRVLLPRSDRAREELPALLRAAGAEVIEVVAYRTLAADVAGSGAGERLLGGDADVAVFASPSAFEHLCEAAGAEKVERMARRTLLAAIGPVTAEAIRAAGLAVAIEAEEATSSGLAEAIVRHFAEKAVHGATPG